MTTSRQRTRRPPAPARLLPVTVSGRAVSRHPYSRHRVSGHPVLWHKTSGRAGPGHAGVGSPQAVVLVLHGGQVESFRPTRTFDPAVMRLRPIARTVGRHLPEAAVYRLQFAIRGWNSDGADALRDARWALAELRTQHPGLPIALVGHSMGARAALRIGGDSNIAGVVALTPWSPPEDPADHLARVPLVVIQGGADRICPESETLGFLAKADSVGARVQRTVLPRLGHAMIRRFWLWHRLTWQGVQTVLAQSWSTESGTAG